MSGCRLLRQLLIVFNLLFQFTIAEIKVVLILSNLLSQYYNFLSSPDFSVNRIVLYFTNILQLAGRHQDVMIMVTVRWRRNVIRW